MAERHLSMRGDPVDFNKLRLANASKVALGNANMNAKGDIIGERGVILKTQEQIEAEWASKIAEQQQITQGVNIKDRNAVASAAGSHQVPPPPANMQYNPVSVEVPNPEVQSETQPDAQPRQRRKIVESDE